MALIKFRTYIDKIFQIIFSGKNLQEFNPERRISAEEALSHPYFDSEDRDRTSGRIGKTKIEPKDKQNIVIRRVVTEAQKTGPIEKIRSINFPPHATRFIGHIKVGMQKNEGIYKL